MNRKDYDDLFGVITRPGPFYEQPIYLPRFVLERPAHVTTQDLIQFPELATDGYAEGDTVLPMWDEANQHWYLNWHIFRVNEWSAFFEVEHVETGETQTAGDGVDVFQFDDEFIDCPCHSTNPLCPLCFGTGVILAEVLSCGNPLFNIYWEWELNQDANSVYEAFFPELEPEEYAPYVRRNVPHSRRK